MNGFTNKPDGKNGPEEGEGAGALVARPNLGDADSAAELFSYAAADFLHGIYGTPGESFNEEAVAGIVFSLAALLEGTSGIVDLPDGFTLSGAAARLRPVLERRINAMSIEDRKIFDEDEAVVTLALNVFFEDLVRKADERFNEGPADDEALHAFLADDEVYGWIRGEACRILGI